MENLNKRREMKDATNERTSIVTELLERMKEMMRVESIDEETTKMIERLVVLRVSTKHINLWIRLLEIKRREMCELAGMIAVEEIKKEIETERNQERWAKRCTNHFTKKVKRMLYEEIDNIVWSGVENEISEWCKRNKVYDEITEEEIEEIWIRESPEEGESIRLNGKYVWETAKRICNFINAHEDIIQITTFGEYKVAMKNAMSVIKEAHNVERKRRQMAWKNKIEETSKTIQKAKALIVSIKRGQMENEEIKRKLDAIFGKGSHQEITNARTTEKIIERIEEMSKQEQQYEKWEMRQDMKRKQREDRRFNIFGGKTSASRLCNLEEMMRPQIQRKR